MRGVYGHVRRQYILDIYCHLGDLMLPRPSEIVEIVEIARSRSKFGVFFPVLHGKRKKNAVDVSNLSKSYNLLMARVWKVSWVRGVGKNCLQGKCGVRNVSHMICI